MAQRTRARIQNRGTGERMTCYPWYAIALYALAVEQGADYDEAVDYLSANGEQL